MKVRIRFSKTGAMKFIGHLDMLRYFQKLMRRADIPIAYSDGFNPHQKMSFGAPLGLGLTSDGEYLDIELLEPISSAKAIEAMNANNVEGVEVLSFKELPEKCENAMAAVRSSDYEIRVKLDHYNASSIEIAEAFKEFISLDDITILKKTKRAEKEVNIKPFIYDNDVCIEEDCIKYYLHLSTGSTDNIKPELVIEEFHKRIGLESGQENTRAIMQIHRLDTYTELDGKRLSLGEIGSDIQ